MDRSNDDRSNDDLAVSLAMLKAGQMRKPKLSPVEHARRFAIEKAMQQRRYCEAFALWRTCRQKSCCRQQSCGGDQNACLKRALDRVRRDVQVRARQDILESTPRNIGAPERAARQCMPRDFYE
jgi:hypothetical protein